MIPCMERTTRWRTWNWDRHRAVRNRPPTVYRMFCLPVTKQARMVYSSLGRRQSKQPQQLGLSYMHVPPKLSVSIKRVGFSPADSDASSVARVCCEEWVGSVARSYTKKAPRYDASGVTNAGGGGRLLVRALLIFTAVMCEGVVPRASFDPTN